jgi:hypothetical protein
VDDALCDTHRNNLLEIVEFLEEVKSRDAAEFAATGDEQKRLDAAAKTHQGFTKPYWFCGSRTRFEERANADSG